MGEEDKFWSFYGSIGVLTGYLIGGLTFLGAWAYCAATYGFLFGFGLGWLPAIILAVIVGGLSGLLWPLFWLCVVVVGAKMLGINI